MVAIRKVRKRRARTKEDTMNLMQLFLAVPAAFLILGSSVAIAGQTVDVAGTIACVTDNRDEKEPDKGHKLVDAAMRCVVIPDDAALPKFVQDCVGKYEYMPDKSWKSAGTCTGDLKGGDKIYDTWEEGSHLKEYTYKYTGGTGTFEGASGRGTYMYESLTDTLTGGTYKGQLVLP
jgi:hypothetical protein